MSSPKIKAQGQNEGHVTSAFMLYFLKKKNYTIIATLSNTEYLIWYIVVYIT